MEFMSFSSGSCGNCYFLSYKDRNTGESSGLLIDAGISLKRLKKYLAVYGLGFDAFSGILITHDHMDHVRHLGSFCKRLSTPVYATSVLHKALAKHPITFPYLADCKKELADGKWQDIGPFKVRYFIVPHDATQTVGFVIKSFDHTLVHITDVGEMTDEAIEFAKEADTVVIEANYDLDMLMAGPYTYDLKMRIINGCGHLSNDACAAAVRRFYHKGLKNIFLCHLSENNNTPLLAVESVREALKSIGVAFESLNLRALPRQNPSPLMDLF